MSVGSGTHPAEPVPSADQLERLPPDAWAVVLTHARAALLNLGDELLTRELVQLRATPPGRLAGGRMRALLCARLAEGGVLWRETVRRLKEDPAGVQLDLRGATRGSGTQTPGPHPSRQVAAADADLVERLRLRNRELVRQRDESRRRAQGATARAAQAQRDADQLRAEVAALRDARDDLAARLVAAEQAARTTAERLHRQHAAERAELREELRDLRRELAERQVTAARRERERATAEARAAEEIAEFRAGSGKSGPLAVAGRPSRLPAGVLPGTPEAVAALIDGGRLIFVDGYNVTKQHRGHLDLEQQRRWLVAALEALAARTGAVPRVVFDGADAQEGPMPLSRTVRVSYARGESADDAIVAAISTLPVDVPAMVVTDDRELGERLVRHAVDVVGTRPFLAVVG